MAAVNSAEIIAMSHAIKIAQSSDAPLGPNPRVGCVVLNARGEYLTQGYHRGRGERHAEIEAIKSTDLDLTGSTAVVTLEPCLNLDRETDCARELINSGISKVIFAQSDLTAKSTGGESFLLEHGIEVVKNVMLEEASSINPWFTIAMSQQRPYLRLKIAASLDGKVATKTGSSKWITGSDSRSFVHKLRAQSHSILSSIRTALLDNAAFSARINDGNLYREQPNLYLLGSGTISEDHPLFLVNREVTISSNESLETLLNKLWLNQELSVLAEAGPKLSTALIRAGLVNELYWFTAPVIIGSDGYSAIDSLGVEFIDQALRPHLKSQNMIGVDFLSIYEFAVSA